MLRIFLTFAVIGIIFIMSPERDSTWVLPAPDSGRASAWPSVTAKVGPRVSEVAATLEAVEGSAQRFETVRRIVMPAATVPIEMPPLRR